MENFLKSLTEAYKNNVQAKLESFKVQNKNTVIIGNNKYGEMWAERLKQNGVNFIGFIQSSSKEPQGDYRLEDVLNLEWNVCICSLDFDSESKIAKMMHEHKKSYIDLTYVVNNRFIEHYDTGQILMNLDQVYQAYSLLSDKASQRVYL